MQTKKLKDLPPLPESNEEMTGPAPDTNMIVPGRIYNGPCVGSYWGNPK